jgi:hypothetical protein
MTSEGTVKAVTFTYSVAKTFGYTFECVACEMPSRSGNPAFKECHGGSYSQSNYLTDSATHSVSYGGAEVISYSAATSSASGSESYEASDCGDGLTLSGTTSDGSDDGWWRFAESGYYGGAWTGPGSQYLCVKTVSNTAPDIAVNSLESGDSLAAVLDDYYVYDFEEEQWYTAKTPIGFA